MFPQFLSARKSFFFPAFCEKGCVFAFCTVKYERIIFQNLKSEKNWFCSICSLFLLLFFAFVESGDFPAKDVF